MKNECIDEKIVVVEQRELPHDLIAHNILTRLDIQSLVRCKSVSKQWYSTISSHHFAHAHVIYPRPSHSESLLIRSDDTIRCLSYKNHGKMKLLDLDVQVGPMDYGDAHDQIDVDEKLILVGSCNGLVCLGSPSYKFKFILWNPITHNVREYRADRYEIIELYRPPLTTWGFGYVSATDDYKVVRIIGRWWDYSPERVDVFSTRSQKWRRIVQDVSHHNFFYKCSSRCSIRPGVLVNETLYWLDGPTNIVSFNLGLEVFDTFSPVDVSPPLGWAMRNNDVECCDEILCVVKGSLSKYIKFSDDAEVIAILKHPGETEQIRVSTELFNAKDLLEPCKFSSRNNLIGFTGCDKMFAIYFGAYEARIGIMDLTSLQPANPEQLVTLACSSDVFRVVAYSPSLISPDSITSEPESNI